MIFSKRLELAKETEAWIKKNNVKNDALGVICALNVLGHLAETEKETIASIKNDK